jgi:hypothetical protein
VADVLHSGNRIVDHHEACPIPSPVRLWLGETLCLAGQVIDAGPGSVRVALTNWVPADSPQSGIPCRLEIQPERQAKVWCHVEVERVTCRWVDLRIAQGLRAVLLQSPAVEELARLSAAITKAIRSMSAVTRPSIGEHLESLALTAVREAAHGNWKTVTATVSQLAVLVRFALKLDELPAEDRDAIRAALKAARDVLMV